jgi:dynein light chain Tctex-type 1
MGEEGTDEFLVEDVETIIKGALQSVLSDTTWDPAKIGTWANMVEEAVLKGLQGLGRGFKYVATVVLMQKNGAGLHTAAGAFWDTKKDGEHRRRAIARARGRAKTTTAPPNAVPNPPHPPLSPPT